MDPLASAQSLGFILPSPAYIFASVLFGLIGWAAWRFGKKRERPLTKWLGVVLMVYPYFVSQTWLVFAVGAALCAAMLLDRG